jgi:hypothetical protein
MVRRARVVEGPGQVWRRYRGVHVRQFGCGGKATDGWDRGTVPQFKPIQTGQNSFKQNLNVFE